MKTINMSKFLQEYKGYLIEFFGVDKNEKI